MPRPRERLRAPRFDYEKVQAYIMGRLEKEAPLRGSQLANAKYPIHVIRRALQRMITSVEGTDEGYQPRTPLPAMSETIPANDPQPPQPEAPTPSRHPVLRKARRPPARVNGGPQISLDAARALEIEINRKERSIGLSVEGMRLKLLFRG